MGQISRILFYLADNNIYFVPVEMVDKLFPGKSLWQLELSWSQSRVTWTSWDQQDTRLLLFNILMQSHFLSNIYIRIWPTKEMLFFISIFYPFVILLEKRVNMFFVVCLESIFYITYHGFMGLGIYCRCWQKLKSMEINYKIWQAVHWIPSLTNIS